MGEEGKEEGVKVKATYIRITVIIITILMIITIIVMITIIIIMITIIITATLPLYHHPRFYPGWRDVRQ